MDKSDRMRQLWLAAVLLTRLPLPHLPNNAFADGARAVWAYPLIGVGIGAAGALTGQIAVWLDLPAFSAAALALGMMMLVTGAMHEDGLADVFDGFWGGFTPERRLEIMRDSQIGSYGVLALVVMFALRVGALAAVITAAPLALVAAATVSRASMPVLMHLLPHARTDGLSHSVGRPARAATATGVVIAGIVGLVCIGGIAVPAVVMTLAVCALLGRLARSKIGGQSGDVLGATQQLSETAVLLVCASLL